MSDTSTIQPSGPTMPPPQGSPGGSANTVVLINWNAKKKKFVLHQTAPIRLKRADTVTLHLTGNGGGSLPPGSKISHVVIYHKVDGGSASKTPSNRLGTWHCNAADPTAPVYMGAYTVAARNDKFKKVDIEDTEMLSPGLEHVYVYSVEIETDDEGRFLLDPELINEADLPTRGGIPIR